MQKKKIWC